MQHVYKYRAYFHSVNVAVPIFENTIRDFQTRARCDVCRQLFVMYDALHEPSLTKMNTITRSAIGMVTAVYLCVRRFYQRLNSY